MTVTHVESSANPIIRAMQSVTNRDALQFGVKGMKWGVRRSRSQLAKASADADPDAVKAVETQAKIKAAGSLNVVSSKDLQQLVDRMKLEDKYVQQTLATSPTTKKGGSFLRRILKNEAESRLLRGQQGPIEKIVRDVAAGRKKKAAATAATTVANFTTTKPKDNPFQAQTNPAYRRKQRAEKIYEITTVK